MKEYQLKRTSRKSCVHSRGIHEFGFDFDKEFCRWKFVSGITMSKKEWKTAQELQLEGLTSSGRWQEDITQRYGKCSNIQLKEFKSYLSVVRANIEASSKFSNKINSCVISSIISILLTQYITRFIGKTELSFLAQFVTSALYVLSYAVVLVPVSLLLVDYFFHMRENDFKLFFIDSYIEVIKGMCCIQQETDSK